MTSLISSRQATFQRAIETHARPAHLLVVRELNTIPGSQANEFTIRSIGALAQSQEADPIEPDAMLAIIEGRTAGFHVFTYGFAMDTDRPRITLVRGQASLWDTVPSSLELARTWGAIALVDIDAVLPFILLDSLGPGDSSSSSAARHRARAASLVETLDCDLPRASDTGCITPVAVFETLMRGDTQQLSALDGALEPLGGRAVDLALGCLMRFDPDPTPLPLCVPSELMAVAADEARRTELAEQLLSIAADMNTDGPNRMRAADAVRHLVRHHPDVEPDTNALHPFIAAFLQRELDRRRDEAEPEAPAED